jgi:hypothetical protein
MIPGSYDEAARILFVTGYRVTTTKLELGIIGPSVLADASRNGSASSVEIEDTLTPDELEAIATWMRAPAEVARAADRLAAHRNEERKMRDAIDNT